MELVRRHRRGKTRARQRRDPAVAEMAPPLGEAGDERQEAEHGMARSVRRDQRFPKGHVASAFAIDARAPARRLQHALAETVGIGKGGGVELRIAAGKIDGIGIAGRRGIGERREEGEARARFLPAKQQVLVAEGEGLIFGNGDTLAERRQVRDGGGRWKDGAAGGDGGETVEIAAARNDPGRMGDEGFERAMLAGLHEAEVPLRQGKRRIAV